MTDTPRRRAQPAPDEQESPVRNAASEMRKSEFAALFGLSEKQIQRFCQDGMPHRKERGIVYLVMPQARVWYHNYLVEKGKREAMPKTRAEARERQESARAAREELELAKELEQTMLVADHERLLADAFGRVRAKLLNLPPRIAGAAYGAVTITECQAKVEPLIYEVMEELAAADDVPDAEDESEAA